MYQGTSPLRAFEGLTISSYYRGSPTSEVTLYTTVLHWDKGGVLITEVSSVQMLCNTQLYFIETEVGVLISEVPLVEIVVTEISPYKHTVLVTSGNSYTLS